MVDYYFKDSKVLTKDKFIDISRNLQMPKKLDL